MITGICEVRLRIYQVNSLKEKRQIIKSIIGKLQSRFNISIAETDLNDLWQSGVIGFACVSNNTAHVNEIISKVIRFIEGDSRVEIIDYNMEIF